MPASVPQLQSVRVLDALHRVRPVHAAAGGLYLKKLILFLRESKVLPPHLVDDLVDRPVAVGGAVDGPERLGGGAGHAHLVLVVGGARSGVAVGQHPKLGVRVHAHEGNLEIKEINKWEVRVRVLFL